MDGLDQYEAAHEQAIGLLMQHMPASKVARVLAAWQIGTGDYVKAREKLFAGATVESLFETARGRKTPQEN